MLKARDIQRWYQCPCVFDVQGVFRINAVLREKLVDRGAQKLAVDEDVKRDTVRIAVQEVIDECRKLVSTQS